MTVTVRFAPSPTGRLHVGNARIALANWLFARRNNGAFILRLDDTDTERSTEEFARLIEEDLRWLGLEWDSFFRESDRISRYEAAVARLKESGRLYPCFETPEELGLKRKSQLAARRPPVYDRAALKLTPEQRAESEASGRKPHWRFLLTGARAEWDDLVRGPSGIDTASLSDPVLLRDDGRPLYTLTSVVDDIDSEISHVIRGEDHVANTGAQIDLFRALGASPPGFAHLPLLVDESGEGLSKRLGSLSLGELRARGIEAMAVNSYLAALGTSDAVEPRTELNALVRHFDMGRVSHSSPRFDPAELEHLNVRLLHELPFASVRARLETLGLSGADENFWQAVRGNIATLADCAEWWRVCHQALVPVVENPAVTETALALLPPEPWTAETWSEAGWKNFTAAIAGQAGAKGKALFHPLRLALTGRENGPELRYLLPLIGPARVRSRLRGETA